MDIGKFQDAVHLTPIAGSNHPLKLLDTTIKMYQDNGVSEEVIGKFMYCLALICNTYDGYDLNHSAYAFLAAARNFYEEQDA